MFEAKVVVAIVPSLESTSEMRAKGREQNGVPSCWNTSCRFGGKKAAESQRDVDHRDRRLWTQNGEGKEEGSRR